MGGSDLEIRPNAVYTVAEVCQILRISDPTLRRWLKRSKLRGARLGRGYRFLGSQLLEALYPTAAATAPVAKGRH